MSEWREDLLSAEEMRAAEATYPGPMSELMERAGRACAECASATFGRAHRWAVHCGGGANGGDGFVAARHLVRLGHDVELVVHGEIERFEGDTAANYRRCIEAGIPVGPGHGAEAVLDALLGTGFAGDLRPRAGEAIAAINAAAVPTVSVDLPSGVDASTGEMRGAAVRADLTVTFHRRKVGHVVLPGAERAGRVVVADIGLAAPAAQSPSAVARLRERVVSEIPVRGRLDNKYTAGAVLVVGGSTGLSGAPALASIGALRAGAGAAVMCIPASLNTVFEAQVLEVMTRPCPDSDGALNAQACDTISEAAQRADAVVLGPGLGRAPSTAQLVAELLEKLSVPVVLDADGLWPLNGRLDQIASRSAPTVLTPHAGELGRLLGRSSEQINAARLAAAREAADIARAVVLLKGADTIIVDGARPGAPTLVSDLGTPGLATAGSGDVLAGVVAALLAKDMAPADAAAAATGLTALAAVSAGERIGEPGLIASDVATELPAVLSRSRPRGRAEG